MQNTSILVIYTGGTIGMVQDKQSGALQPFDFAHLYQHIPILRNFDYQLSFHSFDPLLDSSNMNPQFWIQLAEIIEEKYEKYDGFVILHGSDTMAYTASMLSFMLENLNKPVIFTGSQLPIGVIRTDARDNFINSIEIAAAKEDNTPLVPEVAIQFENKLYRGNRTTKYNAENFDAFLSGNYPILAEVGVYIRYNRNSIARPNFKKLKVYRNLDTHIAICKLFPGISEAAVNAILHTEGLKAVILETFGAGNAPTHPGFLDALRQAAAKDIIIYNVTQCRGGSVDLGKYETSAELGKIGVISGYDITTESAVTKLMFLLGQNLPTEETKRLLQAPLRGEMTL
ncbi:MAG: type I asparaginase [Lentimicrobiaceae bacterium]|nr:type I asparaginase [Lentimicrobiaceae bacterium]